MKITHLLSVAVFFCITNIASADTFGTGVNQFEIEFVTISGDASSANGTYIGHNDPEGFCDPGNDFRMGTYEITNDQWNKFKNGYGTVTGSPSTAYDFDPYWTGTNLPTNSVSWYEAAQFVNYLNTSTGHQAAYKFTGVQGTNDYSFTVWDVTDAGYNASNPYRNSNAFYFLPTEHEWIKAGYWNGTDLQTFATQNDIAPVAKIDSNYVITTIDRPWNVGSGTQEVNGTYDMMGNVWEWMENPKVNGEYSVGASRDFRGGSYYDDASWLRSASHGGYGPPEAELKSIGFRVASVPEPATVSLLALGGLALLRKRK